VVSNKRRNYQKVCLRQNTHTNLRDYRPRVAQMLIQISRFTIPKISLVHLFFADLASDCQISILRRERSANYPSRQILLASLSNMLVVHHDVVLPSRDKLPTKISHRSPNFATSPTPTKFLFPQATATQLLLIQCIVPAPSQTVSANSFAVLFFTVHPPALTMSTNSSAGAFCRKRS
jgi:hypothetical protein